MSKTQVDNKTKYITKIRIRPKRRKKTSFLQRASKTVLNYSNKTNRNIKKNIKKNINKNIKKNIKLTRLVLRFTKPKKLPTAYRPETRSYKYKVHQRQRTDFKILPNISRAIKKGTNYELVANWNGVEVNTDTLIGALVRKSLKVKSSNALKSVTGYTTNFRSMNLIQKNVKLLQFLATSNFKLFWTKFQSNLTRTKYSQMVKFKLHPLVKSFKNTHELQQLAKSDLDLEVPSIDTQPVPVCYPSRRDSVIGYSWINNSDKQAFYKTNYVYASSIFWNTYCTHSSITTTSIYLTGGLFTMVNGQNWKNLILACDFLYRSFLVDTLTKTAALTEGLLITPNYTKFVDFKLKNSVTNRYLFYSCYEILTNERRTSCNVESIKNITNTKNNILQHRMIYKSFYAYLLQPGVPTFVYQTSPWLVTKKSNIVTNCVQKSIELVKNQWTMNKVTIDFKYETKSHETITKKPSIFTFKSSLQNYLMQQNLIASYSGRYFYWSTTDASTTLNVKNHTINTPYLLNWNENEIENSLYLIPHGSTWDQNSKNLTEKLYQHALMCQYSQQDTLAELWTSEQEEQTELQTQSKIKNTPPLALFLKTPLTNHHSFKKLLAYLILKIKKFIIDKKLLQLPLQPNVSQIESSRLLNNQTMRAYKHLKYRLHQKSLLFDYKPAFMRYLLKQPFSEQLKTALKTYYTERSKIKKRKKYLLKIKSSESKESKPSMNRIFKKVQFYNKIVAIETRKSKKLKKLPLQLNRLTRLQKKKKYLKKHFHTLASSLWLRNTNLLNLSIDTKMLNSALIDTKTDVLNWGQEDELYDLQERTVRSMVLSKDLDDILTSDLAVGDYLAWLGKHYMRNDAVVATQEHYTSVINYSIKNTTNVIATSRNQLNVVDMTTNNLLSNLFFLNTLLNQKLLFKYYLMKTYNYSGSLTYQLTHESVKNILNSLNVFYFNSRSEVIQKSNLYPTHYFNYSLKRRLIKLFVFRRFSARTSIWYFNMLIRFMEFCTGRKTYLKLDPHIENSLTFTDQIQCQLWEWRVFGFQKILGPKIFVNESLRIILLALKYKDPTFLINWTRAMLYRMSFWKYRTLFRYLKFVLKNLFEPNFEKFGLRGFKLRLRGKISVAGNARTRTLLMRIGRTSHSQFDNKIAHSFTTVNSFTGVMGFNMWIFF